MDELYAKVEKIDRGASWLKGQQKLVIHYQAQRQVGHQWHFIGKANHKIPFLTIHLYLLTKYQTLLWGSLKLPLPTQPQHHFLQKLDCEQASYIQFTIKRVKNQQQVQEMVSLKNKLQNEQIKLGENSLELQRCLIVSVSDQRSSIMIMIIMSLLLFLICFMISLLKRTI